MPICNGCGASYDDSFQFCPHCGRSRPEPQKIIVEHVVQNDDRLTRKDVILILSGGGEYRSKSTGENWIGEKSFQPVFRANLSGVNLSGIDLSSLDLSGVNFKGSNFEGANLSRSNLENALVSCANLKNAILREANLSRANFIESILHNADLSEARLDDTIFNEADLTDADFSNSYYVVTNPRFRRAIVEKMQVHQVKRIKKGFFDKLFG